MSTVRHKNEGHVTFSFVSVIYVRRRSRPSPRVCGSEIFALLLPTVRRARNLLNYRRSGWCTTSATTRCRPQFKLVSPLFSRYADWTRLSSSGRMCICWNWFFFFFRMNKTLSPTGGTWAIFVFRYILLVKGNEGRGENDPLGNRKRVTGCDVQ